MSVGNQVLMWLKHFSIPDMTLSGLCIVRKKCIGDVFTTVEQESLPKDSGVENQGQRSVVDQTK